MPQPVSRGGSISRLIGYFLLHLIVLRLCKLGKLADESYGIPDFVILERLAVGGHAGHLDSVLDDPEQLGVGPTPYRVSQIRGFWIEALADIPWILFRRAVAVNARPLDRCGILHVLADRSAQRKP